MEFDDFYKKQLEQRIFEKIEERDDGCWFWLASCGSPGHPQIGGTYKGEHWNSKVRPLVYAAVVGEVPAGKFLKRACGTGKCVSPHHAVLTDSEEITRAALVAQPRPTRDSDKERFMEYVEKANNGCWLWTGGKLGASSYGQFWMDGRQIGAHRASQILFNGPIPDGYVVMHACDDRECVNPAHLSPGTVRENAEDMVRKDRHPCGERSGSNKLSEEQVAAIKGEYVKRDGELVRLANKYLVDMSTIHDIVSGRTWQHTDIPLGSMPSDDAAYVRPTRGEKNSASKLTEANVIELRDLRRQGVTVRVLAEKYGVSEAQVSSAATGRDWGHVPGALPVEKARMTDDVVSALRGEYIEGRWGENARLSVKYGIPTSYVSNIISGKKFSHVQTPLGSAPSDDAPLRRVARTQSYIEELPHG